MSGSKERQFRANKLNASRNSVYPGPWGQLAQNALFALVSLPRLPGEGGWMQTACWELFLDCFEQELSRKMQLGTRVCAEELSNHFLPWMYFQCLGTPFFSSRDAAFVQQDLFTGRNVASAAFQLPPTWIWTSAILPNPFEMC